MRQALGKGIGALIPPPRPRDAQAPQAPQSASNPVVADASEEIVGTGTVTVREIPIVSITANPRQPRSVFDEESIADLASSIRVHGVLQPILVRSLGGEGYELIAGERRLRAARLAGLEQIPALVKQSEDDDSLVLAIVENLQRAQLSAIEEARAFRQLMEDFGLTQEEVAGRVGRSRPAVANTLRLLHLPETVIEEIERGRLSAGHARALLGAEGDSVRENLAREVVRRNLSVRDTEDAVRRAATTPAAPSDPDLRLLEKDLERTLGSKVRVHATRSGSGKLEISFYSNDDLARLADLLGTVRRAAVGAAR